MNATRQVLIRFMPLEATIEGDGRTIVGRCVPYGEVADVADGDGEPYREKFVRGAFKSSIRAPHRVLLDFEHQQTPLDVVGHATKLEERDDGLWGEFAAVGRPGEQALELVRAGVLGGMSVHALAFGPGRRDGDVVVRNNCRLNRVALCREPAYAGAVVEALRARADMSEPAALTAMRPVRDVELDAALLRLGIGSPAPR